MNWPDFLHLALFAAIILHAVCDAAMDANAHLRIHLALHPLRDSWHIFKHISRACLLACGALLPAAWDWDKWATVIVVGCGIVIGKFTWDAVYGQPWRWLHLDETVHIRTGWKWLDKQLGLHY